MDALAASWTTGQMAIARLAGTERELLSQRTTLVRRPSLPQGWFRPADGHLWRQTERLAGITLALYLVPLDWSGMAPLLLLACAAILVGTLLTSMERDFRF